MHPVFNTLLASYLRPKVFQRIRFDIESLAPVQFGLARSVPDRVAAFRLAHAEYLRQGLITAAADAAPSLRVTPFQFLPTTAIFVAKVGGVVVGTLSNVEDSLLGLPMEPYHGREAQRLRQGPLRYAETSPFCVTPAYRHSGVAVSLINIMGRWARGWRGLDGFVVAIHPRAETFFQITFNAHRLGPVQRYHALNDALSVPVMLGGLAGSARDWIQRHYDNDRCRLGSGPHAPNFSDYLYGPMPHNMHLPPHTDDVVPNPWTAQEIVDCCRQENIDTRSWTAAQWRALSHYYPELIECIQSTSGVLT